MSWKISQTIKKAGIAVGLAVPILCGGLTGCHSHYIAASIRNNSGAPVTLVEFDYPSASFGKDILGSGAVFHYRFKIIGNGPTKLLWTDANQKDHTDVGPSLHDGEEGSLVVTISATAATWQTNLKP